jgi:AraC family transcriptional regulator of adaptative response / DNA-3-methyladenine glycosylase II
MLGMTYVTAVVTTGIYCCPQGCSGRPLARNRLRFASAAEAEANGFRACHVCRPYRRQPGVSLDAPELVCRALQLVLDGALDGPATEREVAWRVGASARHLRRLFVAHVGVTPTQLARSARAHFARRLIDDTELSFSDIAGAAAFGSIRQFNKVMRDTFRASPTELRRRRRRSDRLVADGGLALRLPFTPPLAYEEMLAYLGRCAIPGVESVEDGWYRRTMAVAGDPAMVEIGPGGPSHLEARFHLPHWEGLLHLVQRARRLFYLDLVQRPGLRVAGTWEPYEVALTWLVGWDRPAAWRDVMRRLVEAKGVEVGGLGHWQLTHLFPEPQALASAPLTGVGLSATAQRHIASLASGIAGGTIRLDRSLGRPQLEEELVSLGPLAAPLAADLAFRLGDASGGCPAGVAPAESEVSAAGVGSKGLSAVSFT